MKKILASLLCMILLVGCAAAASADEEPAAELSDSVQSQAVSMALACWMSGYENGDELSDPLLLWDAAGWYAALLYRIEGSDLLSPERTTAFLESVGWRGVISIPDTWEEYGVVRRLAGSDGRQNLDFVQHKREADDMLGVSTELSVATLDEDTVEAVLTYHMNDEESASWVYEFDFVPAGEGSEFPYCLVGARYRDDGPEVDPELTFTWEGLLEANRLENVLSQFPSVHIKDDGVENAPDTWLFKRGEDLALVMDSQTYVWGQYGGCYFDYEIGGEEPTRPVITEFYDPEVEWESRDAYITDYLSGICLMKLDRIEGDRIWAVCTFRSGFHEKFSFDRGTLVLREIEYTYEDGAEPSVTRFRYNDSVPPFSFLKSWDEALRMLTVVWEDYSNGWGSVHTDFVRVPMDWEYFPYEARWGDYTAYLNKGYTQLYEYPGDYVEYTLYLTTAKG